MNTGRRVLDSLGWTRAANARSTCANPKRSRRLARDVFECRCDRSVSAISPARSCGWLRMIAYALPMSSMPWKTLQFEKFAYRGGSATSKWPRKRVGNDRRLEFAALDVWRVIPVLPRVRVGRWPCAAAVAGGITDAAAAVRSSWPRRTTSTGTSSAASRSSTSPTPSRPCAATRRNPSRKRERRPPRVRRSRFRL